jgi:AraC-like DNA-binding protein
MQINIERINLYADRSFRAYEYNFLTQHQPFHIHDEYELAVVEGIGGVVYCGADTTTFESGDLFLFSGRLPHRFTALNSDDDYGEVLSPETIARVVQFRHDAFGAEFFRIPENAAIQRLLRASRQGLSFRRRATSGLAEKLSMVITRDAHRQLGLLLSLLADLSDLFSSECYDALSPGTPDLRSHDIDAHRISTLQDYIESAYATGATVDGAAERLALTRTSFCRYVKRMTGRTFTELVNDYRLTVAAMKLRDDSATVSAISEDVGFGSLSHFNACFKKRFGTTPTAFRRSTSR